MTLILPVSTELRPLTGGYNSKLDWNLIPENMTNQARNAELGYTIKSRNGYERMLGTALTDTGERASSTLSGARILGHAQISKQNTDKEVNVHCVAAGPCLWNYNSGCATIIMSGLNDAEDARWQFAQIMSPEDGSDDVLIGTNGHDNPVIWNGQTSSATWLSASVRTTATAFGDDGILPAAYLVSVKNRVALLSLYDDADVDAGSAFMLSDFSSEGAPLINRFPAALKTYCGGSDKYGPITGGAAINGNIAIFKRNTVYMFFLGGGTTIDPETLSIVHDFSLKQIDENIGCVAPNSIASIGNAVIFLSELGVYAFDGQSLVYIGEAIENDLKNINMGRRHLAAGVYHRGRNQYWLSVSSQGSAFNNMVYVYDLTKKIWMAPYDNMRCEIMSQFIENKQWRILSGDHQGYLYRLDQKGADGKIVGFNLANPSDASGATITVAASQTMTNTTYDGYLGLSVHALNVDGNDLEYRTITDWTTTNFIVSPPFSTSVGKSDTFVIAGNRSYVQTKDMDFGSDDVDKMVRWIDVSHKNFGNFNFNVNYIFDFNELSNAGSAVISQYNNKYGHWGDGSLATGTAARYSGGVVVTTGTTASSCQVTISGSTTNYSSSKWGLSLTNPPIYFWCAGDTGSAREVYPIKGACGNIFTIGNYGTVSAVMMNSNTVFTINLNTLNTFDNCKWGPSKFTGDKINLRAFGTQDIVGKRLAVRLGTDRVNEPFEVFDMAATLKVLGRRG